MGIWRLVLCVYNEQYTSLEQIKRSYVFLALWSLLCLSLIRYPLRQLVSLDLIILQLSEPSIFYDFFTSFYLYDHLLCSTFHDFYLTRSSIVSILHAPRLHHDFF